MNKVNKDDILINILTRTSNRPKGFHNCHQSILNQTYKNVLHFVSFDDVADLDYINLYDVVKVRVKRLPKNMNRGKGGAIHAPYNLYCNELLKKVNRGWVLILDDDDNLLHNNVLEELVKEIKKVDHDTLFLWKMRYPNGKVLPLNSNFRQKKIELNHIGTPNILFHSKYKNVGTWDEWKGADFRFITELFNKIPKKKWIKKVYIQINNQGDFGRQNDINNLVITSKIFYKTKMWWFLPKYHTTIFGVFIFNRFKFDYQKNKFSNKIRLIKNSLNLFRK